MLPPKFTYWHHAKSLAFLLLGLGQKSTNFRDKKRGAAVATPLPSIHFDNQAVLHCDLTKPLFTVAGNVWPVAYRQNAITSANMDVSM